MACEAEEKHDTVRETSRVLPRSSGEPHTVTHEQCRALSQGESTRASRIPGPFPEQASRLLKPGLTTNDKVLKHRAQIADFKRFVHENLTSVSSWDSVQEGEGASSGPGSTSAREGKHHLNACSLLQWFSETSSKDNMF